MAKATYTGRAPQRRRPEDRRREKGDGGGGRKTPNARPPRRVEEIKDQRAIALEKQHIEAQARKTPANSDARVRRVMGIGSEPDWPIAFRRRINDVCSESAVTAVDLICSILSEAGDRLRAVPSRYTNPALALTVSVGEDFLIKPNAELLKAPHPPGSGVGASGVKCVVLDRSLIDSRIKVHAVTAPASANPVVKTKVIPGADPLKLMIYNSVITLFCALIGGVSTDSAATERLALTRLTASLSRYSKARGGDSDEWFTPDLPAFVSLVSQYDPHRLGFTTGSAIRF